MYVACIDHVSHEPIHVEVAADTCMDKNHTIVNIVVMYKENPACVQRADLNNLRMLLKAPLST